MMTIINPNAAGIDIGSKSHFVGIGQRENEVKEFGVYSSDHKKTISYLQKQIVNRILLLAIVKPIFYQGLFFLK